MKSIFLNYGGPLKFRILMLAMEWHFAYNFPAIFLICGYNGHIKGCDLLFETYFLNHDVLALKSSSILNNFHIIEDNALNKP